MTFWFWLNRWKALPIAMWQVPYRNIPLNRRLVMSFCQKCRGLELEKQWCEHCNKTGVEPGSVLDKFVKALQETGNEKWIPVSDPVEVGKALRKMRLSLCQTQGFMADLFGISVSQWSKLEKGRTDT